VATNLVNGKGSCSTVSAVHRNARQHVGAGIFAPLDLDGKMLGEAGS
jgi:hypothetical protein